MFRNSIICLLMMCCFVLLSSAQNEWVYELSGGFSLHNNGWGGGLERRVSLKNHSVITELDFTTYRHGKEVNIVNQNARNPRTYVFGKLNHVGIFRLQRGVEKHLTDFGDREHVHLGVSLLAGAGLAVLKPVYLDVYYPGSSNDGLVLPERYNPSKHTNQADILGYSARKYGWDELTAKPVIQMKGSLNLYWGGVTSTEKMMKAGAVVSWFPAGIPIMAFTQNSEVGIAFFLSFYFSREMEM